MAKIFGHIEGQPVGVHYLRRRELREAGLHAPLMDGIHGNAREGADSIVVSGGYVDDVDQGDVIIYTGHGGRGPDGRQIRDQKITDPGNAGLVTSELEGYLVRVIRGAGGDSPTAPATGFRYDGLFRVESHFSKVGVDGYRIWQFRLVAAERWEQATPFEAALSAVTSEETIHQPAPRTATIEQRIVRNSRVIQQVKGWHKGQCQICHVILEIPSGARYSEGAHIQALADPHLGPDIPENVLCLCPTCHVLFDTGARYLTDQLTVVNGLTHTEIGELRQHRQHRIGTSFVRQHRGRWITLD